MTRRPAGAASADRLGGRAVGRWMLVRLARLPPDGTARPRARRARDGPGTGQAGALAGLGPAAAGAAADALAAVGIVEPRRPLAFAHPMVREALYAELSRRRARAGPRRAARLLHARARRPSGSPSTCSPPSRPPTRGPSSGWPRRPAPPRAAARRSRRRLLRRALAEPPPEARGPSGSGSPSAAWPRRPPASTWYPHLERAIAAAADPRARAGVALATAQALRASGRRRRWPCSTARPRPSGRATRRAGHAARGDGDRGRDPRRAPGVGGDRPAGGPARAAAADPAAPREALAVAAWAAAFATSRPRRPSARPAGAAASPPARARSGRPPSPGSPWSRSCWSGPSATTSPGAARRRRRRGRADGRGRQPGDGADVPGLGRVPARRPARGGGRRPHRARRGRPPDAAPLPDDHHRDPRRDPARARRARGGRRVAGPRGGLARGARDGPRHAAPGARAACASRAARRRRASRDLVAAGDVARRSGRARRGSCPGGPTPPRRCCCWGTATGRCAWPRRTSPWRGPSARPGPSGWRSGPPGSRPAGAAARSSCARRVGVLARRRGAARAHPRPGRPRGPPAAGEPARRGT